MSEVSGGTAGTAALADATAPDPAVLFSIAFPDPVSGTPRVVQCPPAAVPVSSSASPAVFDAGALAASCTSLLYVLTLSCTDGRAPLSLSLRCEPPDVLALQLHNENVRDGRMVQASSVYQLLNEVDYVDRLTLHGGQRTQLILVVHPHVALQRFEGLSPPAPPASSARSSSPPPLRSASPSTAVGGSAAASPPPSPTHRLVTVSGSVHFTPLLAGPCAAPQCLTLQFRCRVGRSVLSVAAADRDLLFDHCVPNTIYHRQITLRNASELPTSLVLHMRQAEDGDGGRAENDAGQHRSHRHHHHHHHHHSRSRPRDGSGRTSSPSAVASPHAAVAPPPVFEMTDVDTGRRVMIHSDAAPFGSVSPSHPRVVPSLSVPASASIRLRVSFRPPALTFDLHRRFLGEHVHALSVINQADASNVLHIALHTMVSADRRAAGLLILPPSSKVQAEYKSIARTLAAVLGVQRDREHAIALTRASPQAGGSEPAEGAGNAARRWGEAGEADDETELSDIDFGDCYTGDVVARLFSLHNKTGEPLELHLGASAAHARGEVSFHLLQDLYDGGRKGAAGSSGSGGVGGGTGGSSSVGREARHRQRALLKEINGLEPSSAPPAPTSLHPLDDEHSVHLPGVLEGDSAAQRDGGSKRSRKDETEQQPQVGAALRAFTPSLTRIDSEHTAADGGTASSPTATSPDAQGSQGLIKQMLLAHERRKVDALSSPVRRSPSPRVAASEAAAQPSWRLSPLHSSTSPPMSSISPLSSSVSFEPLHLVESPVSSGLSPLSLVGEGRNRSEIALDLQTIQSPSSAASLPSPPRGAAHFSSSSSRTGGTAQPTSSSPSASSSSASALQLSAASAPSDARSSRVEMIVLPPGRRQDLMVIYKPEADIFRGSGRSVSWHPGSGLEGPSAKADGVDNGGGDGESAFSLQARKFRVTFDIRSAQSSSSHGAFSSSPPHGPSSSSSWSTFTKRLRATARVCESFVSLERSAFHFGDVNLGTKQAASVRLVNHSELPASMEVSLASQSVRVRRMALHLAARASHELKLDFVPRKVNPAYHKDIAIANVHNAANRLTLRLTAVIVDEHRVLFHSTFYQLTSPTFPELEQYRAADAAGTVGAVAGEREVQLTAAAAPAVRRSQSFSAHTVGRPLLPRASLATVTSSYHQPWTQSSAALASAAAPGEELPSTLHLLHFGRMVENNPWVRVFNVTNLAAAPIELRWSTSEPSELRVMREQIDSAAAAAAASAAAQATSIPSSGGRTGALCAVDEAGEDSAKPVDDGWTDGGGGMADAVSVSHQSFLHPVPTRASLLPPGSALSDLWLRFLTFCRVDAAHNHEEAVPSASPSFASSPSTSMPSLSSLLASAAPPDSDLLRRHCKREIHRRRDVQRVIEQGLLAPLEVLQLAPFQTVRVYAVWTIGAVQRPWMSTKLRSLDAEISVELTRYPQPHSASSSASSAPAVALPPRCLPVQCLVCRSVLDVSQKHIHFGTLTSMDKHEKALVLHNQSEAPLLFALRKTGSIASSDLIFPQHSLGVVRAYGHLEIPFIFKPSLAGAFNEPVTVENLQDPSNVAVVSIKAQLRKPLHFWLKGLQLDFGFALLSSGRTAEDGKPDAVAAAPAGEAGTAEDEDAEDDDESDLQLLHTGSSDGGVAALSQWIVLKNISSKPRAFKAQLRSLRLQHSRSKADILELALSAEQQLAALMCRQPSTESFRTSASSSSLPSPEELSPSPPFSGASSPRVSVQGREADGVTGPSPVPVSASTPSLQSLTHLAHPPNHQHAGLGHGHGLSSSLTFGFAASPASTSQTSASVPASPASANGGSPHRSASRTPPPQSVSAESPFASLQPGHLSTSSLSSFASYPSPLTSSDPFSMSNATSPVSSAAPAAPPLRRLPIMPTVSFHLEDVSGGGGEPNGLEREEEEELLQRKLRIAVRKMKHDKVDKIKKRLHELHALAQREKDKEDVSRRGQVAKDAQPHGAAGGGAVHVSDPPHGQHNAWTQTGGSSAADDRRQHLQMAAAAEDGVVFTLEPNAVQSIRTTLHTKSATAHCIAAAPGAPIRSR